ncbi:MAG: cysteine synthase A [Enterobacterales bacterium]|nr:cysteine synthase A [Enterobacterales bacterium]
MPQENILQDISQAIGNTDLLKFNSLSQLTGCEILLKCEQQNPGGSIKDRAALQMISDALASGKLKPGMTIVEGTAGNTGIGLALVAKALALKLIVVMPKGQAAEKERLIQLHGAELVLVDACPFANQNHFYHTARRIAQQREDCWWADQFENTSNYQAHYQNTAPEIWSQTGGHIDAFVSVCGTGGTIAGNSKYLAEKNPNIINWLVDPDGSGIHNFLKTGEYIASAGNSFTEGIAIMRLVENFKAATIHRSVNLPDKDLVKISRYVRDNDGIVLGSSSALNVAGALFAAAKMGKGKRIVTFSCDLGERSYSKLWNDDFLKDKGIDSSDSRAENLFEQYQQSEDYLQL